MGRNYRKRKVVEDEDEDEQKEPELNLREKLADAKALQSQRGRLKGVDADSLLSGPKTMMQEEEAKDKNLDLQDTFANETLVAEEDPNMVKFIEDELARRRGLATSEDGAENSKSELEVLEDNLYSVPKDLSGPQVGDKEDHSDRWLTGIVEVQLPIQHRLDNIEATEKAKATLIEEQKRKRFKDFADRSSIPGNLSVNYNLHKSTFHNTGPGAGGRTTTMQEDTRPPGGQGGHRNSRGPIATDDLVASRFKARERQRRRN